MHFLLTLYTDGYSIAADVNATINDLPPATRLIRLGGSYNEFEAPKVASEFRKFNVLRYYGPSSTFEILCKDLGRRTLADESYKYEEDKNSVTWRLWWD